jgi:threonylcarbamoyladenosine tRNA methylthiotransferase MtaB
VAETVLEAEKIAKTDIKEVVLTGVNIGDFGQGEGENFLDLIKELDKVEGIERFRISSIEPNLLSNEVIDFVAKSNKFVPHFHIPLQAGSNTLLKAMRRKYLRELYAERVEKIKTLMPDACIGVDVIVGFPGETEVEFMETINFLMDLEISYLHVFTYSERANTTAKKMDNAVPMATRRERSQKLHLISDKKRRAFYESQEGKTKKVLFEAEENGGIMHGFSENYVKVSILFDPALINQTVQVRLDKIGMDGNMAVTLLEKIVVG